MKDPGKILRGLAEYTLVYRPGVSQLKTTQRPRKKVKEGPESRERELLRFAYRLACRLAEVAFREVILTEGKQGEVSASTVGRVLSYLKARGVLKEPDLRPISTRRRKQQRP